MKPLLLMSLLTILFQPLAAAVEYFTAKTPIGSVLRSAEWRRIPGELRELAQFSSAVQDVHVLQQIQDDLSAIITQERDAAGRQKMDRSRFIGGLQRVAKERGLTPEDPADRNTLKDITSRARAELIYETQTSQAYGYTNFRAQQDPELLAETPCAELGESIAKEPRTNWPRRWTEAAKESGDDDALRVFQETGRMIARKDSPIWQALGDGAGGFRDTLGNPYPPFAFNSTRLVDNVWRDEAEALGFIRPTETVRPNEARLTDNLSASLAGVDEPTRAWLLREFGDQLEITGDVAKWKPLPGGAA